LVKERHILRQILVEWKEFGIPRDLIRRDISIKPNRGVVTIITGARMSGKTYLMFQTMMDLMRSGIDERTIFYINFEDERIDPRPEFLTELLPAIREEFGVGDKIYLFLDEIHRIPGWERWLRRNLLKDIYFVISGSSSELMPDQISSVLGGRTKTHIVYPLSFREFLRFRKVDVEEHIEFSMRKHDVMRLLEEYMLYGGFPEITLRGSPYEKIGRLQEYFAAIMYRDIVRRHNIDKPEVLEVLLKLLADTTLFSASKMEKTMRSIGYRASKATILKYKSYAEKAYFIYQLEIISPKIKDRLQYPRKIYFIDTGLRRAICKSWALSKSRMFENLVFLTLLRTKRLLENIGYWRDHEGREVDIVIEQNLKVKALYQISYEPMEEETIKREEKALVKAMKQLGIKKGYIVTWDTQTQKTVNGKRIVYIPLWKILLEV